MTTTSKPLILSKYASNSETTEYTVTAGRTIVDKFTGYNGTGATVNLTVKIVPSGSSAGATNVIVLKALTAGETYTFPEVVGHVLELGGFISVLAGSGSAIVIRASGREVT